MKIKHELEVKFGNSYGQEEIDAVVELFEEEDDENTIL